MRQYRKLSRWHRWAQRFNNWTYEFADAKVMVAAFLFLVSCMIWFDKFTR